MNDFYSDIRAVASNVLKEFNQGVIDYVAITPGNGPADDPGRSTETLIPIDGVARGVKFTYIDNSSVLATDLQITIPADVIEPQPGAFVRIDGVRHKIVKIMPKPAAGITVAYVVIVRR